MRIVGQATHFSHPYPDLIWPFNRI